MKVDRVKLYSRELLVGYLNEDLNSLEEMIFNNRDQKRFMSLYDGDIRKEDIRINFTPQVQRIAKALEKAWEFTYDVPIELCWNVNSKQDPNTAFWAVIHEKNESTNLHTHETSENYEHGAHVSAAFYVKVPNNSGNIVFQYNTNPYITRQTEIKAEPNKFVMFDSTLPHFVTKNCSNEERIVISMNFRCKED